MAYYTTGYRRINGERRKVRLLHQNGKIRAVRIAGMGGKYHSTDKSARARGLYRTPGYVNNPQSTGRVDVRRRAGRAPVFSRKTPIGLHAAAYNQSKRTSQQMRLFRYR